MLGPNCPERSRRARRTSGSSRPRSSARGRSGVVSRSGTLTYQIGHELTQRGLGNSTIAGIGGDPVVGSSFIDVLARFEADVQDRGDRDGRRDRRRRGGEGSGVHRGRGDEAGRRLHRRLHRAAREDDGARRARSSPGRRGRRRRRRKRSRNEAFASEPPRPRSRSSRPRSPEHAPSGREQPRRTRGCGSSQHPSRGAQKRYEPAFAGRQATQYGTALSVGRSGRVDVLSALVMR